MKKHLLSILTIVLAVAGSAFTLVTPEAKATQDCVWFIYQGPDASTQVFDDLVDPMNYRRATPSEEEALCTETEQLCAICAPAVQGSPNVPVLTQGSSIEQELAAYFSNPNSLYLNIKEKP